MAINIGFNDPLYIHPSDTPGMSLITDHLIGTDNYGIWSRAMLIALRAKNKTGFIDGTCSRPTLDHPTLHQWERCNALVLSWIMNSVSKEIFGGIVYAVAASSVWTDLKEQYDKINGSRIFSLHRDIGRLTQAGHTISSYYCKLKQLWDEYSSLVVLPSCECATAKQYIAHDQQQKLLQFLMGLNESYTPIRSQILMMSPLPSVSQAFSIISQEESHRSLSATELPSSAHAFSVQGKSTYQKKDVLICDHCNWTGHTKDFCYKLVGYPPNHKLYKSPAAGKKGQNGRFSKDIHRPHRPSANLTDGAQVETSLLNDTGIAVDKTPNGPSIFTPAQYAEILKLLGTYKDHSPADAMVNMAGHTIEYTSLGSFIDANVPILKHFMNAETKNQDYNIPSLAVLSSAMRMLQRHEFKKNHGEWVSSVKPDLGPGISERVWEAIRARDDNINSCYSLKTELRAALSSLLGEFGILAMPTVPGPPPKLQTEANALETFRAKAFSLLSVAGVSGFCQASIPVGMYDGLPIAVSLLANHGADGFLLKLVECMYS